MLRERRREGRYWSNEKVKVWTATDPILPCTLIERSRLGARLLFPDTLPTGDNLLIISDSSGEVNIGVVRWRLGMAVGIEYVRGLEED